MIDDVSWELLRVWHVEVLSSVAESPRAHTFTRTSYGLVPSGWRELAPDELQRRVEIVLEASYRRRNYQMAQSDDPTEMWWIGYTFEWVASDAITADGENALDETWVQTKRAIHGDLIEHAITEMVAKRSEPRTGKADRPWTRGFSLFSVDADGENWTLRRPDPDTLAEFERSLVPA